MTTNPVATGGAAPTTDATTVISVASVGAETPNSATTVGADAKSPGADTVSLQGKARETVKDSSGARGDKTGGRIGSVVFAYNWKGDLRIRFMDSKNALVYQTPPVMMARTADLMMRSDSSVSARV